MICSSFLIFVHKPQKSVQVNPRGITHPRRLTQDLLQLLWQTQLKQKPAVHSAKLRKHPLYACPKFKVLPHDKMLSTVRSSNKCFNCLKSGHFSKDCKSNNRCRKWQKLHHILLHSDSKQAAENQEHPSTNRERVEASSLVVAPMVSSYAQYGSGSVLLMTCQMLVYAPDGTYVQARGLLDSGSSISFVSK